MKDFKWIRSFWNYDEMDDIKSYNIRFSVNENEYTFVFPQSHEFWKSAPHEDAAELILTSLKIYVQHVNSL